MSFPLCVNPCPSSLLKDKTFGLKNKKGKKQQTFVKQVTQQVGEVIMFSLILCGFNKI